MGHQLALMLLLQNNGAYFYNHERECCTRLFSTATCVCFIEGKGALGSWSYALYCLMSANYQFPRIPSYSQKSRQTDTVLRCQR